MITSKIFHCSTKFWLIITVRKNFFHLQSTADIPAFHAQWIEGFEWLLSAEELSIVADGDRVSYHRTARIQAPEVEPRTEIMLQTWVSNCCGAALQLKAGHILTIESVLWTMSGDENVWLELPDWIYKMTALTKELNKNSWLSSDPVTQKDSTLL
jgi:hypothetical protein